jgi:uncharacterized protein (DUF486 family)
MKFVGMAVWLITALAAILVGLEVFNMNYLRSGFLANNAMVVNYVFLIAGGISLLMYILALTGSGCGCCSGGAAHNK